MHHKVMIIDGHIIITGSYNWSQSAEDDNDENIIIIDSASIASEYTTEFNRIWSGARARSVLEDEDEEWVLVKRFRS